jgi:hypothetical protein
MNIEDKKEDLAELFFECARYERPSYEWKGALDKFVDEILEDQKAKIIKMLEQDLISNPVTNYMVQYNSGVSSLIKRIKEVK